MLGRTLRRADLRVPGMVALVLLVAVAAALVVLRSYPHSQPTVAAPGSPGSSGSPGSTGSTSSPGSTGSSGSPGSTGSTGSAPAPSPPAAVAGRPTADELESFVRGYYGLLPGQPARAWTMLGTAARDASNGFDGYTSFYNSLASVSFAQPPTAVDGRTVRATLRFDSKSGGESVERYEFTVVPGPGGALLMSSFTHG